MHNQKIFNNNTCYISGLHRSGKSLLIALLPGIGGTGLINKDPTLNLIPNLYVNKEINFNSARYLARFIQSNVNYSNFIGRKINQKKTDETSIYNHINYSKYLKRVNLKAKSKISSDLIEKEASFYDVHNVLNNLNFWTKVNEDFKLINIIRNPIDLAYSWYMNNLGSFKDSSINQLLLYELNGQFVPSYANRWKNKYINMSELDRIIEILSQQIKDSNKNYRNYKNKEKILIIKYEDLLLNPLNNLRLIKRFLNIRSRIYFNKYKKKINKQNYPSLNKIEKKRKFLKNNCTCNYYRKLIDLESKYT